MLELLCVGSFWIAIITGRSSPGAWKDPRRTDGPGKFNRGSRWHRARTRPKLRCWLCLESLTCPAADRRNADRFPNGATADSERCSSSHLVDRQAGEARRRINVEGSGGECLAVDFEMAPSLTMLSSTATLAISDVLDVKWCPGEDSNLHGVTHWYLKPARLPIPPPGPEDASKGAGSALSMHWRSSGHLRRRDSASTGFPCPLHAPGCAWAGS